MMLNHRRKPTSTVGRDSLTPANMLRLCCVSAALSSAGSSTSGTSRDDTDDSVDVVTLGAIQPPLAGQTRPPGSSSRKRGTGNTFNGMQLADSESLDQTVKRLLHRTLDLGPIPESRVRQEPHEAVGDLSRETGDVNLPDRLLSADTVVGSVQGTAMRPEMEREIDGVVDVPSNTGDDKRVLGDDGVGGDGDGSSVVDPASSQEGYENDERGAMWLSKGIEDQQELAVDVYNEVIDDSAEVGGALSYAEDFKDPRIGNVATDGADGDGLVLDAYPSQSDKDGTTTAAAADAGLENVPLVDPEMSERDDAVAVESAMEQDLLAEAALSVEDVENASRSVAAAGTTDEADGASLDGTVPRKGVTPSADVDDGEWVFSDETGEVDSDVEGKPGGDLSTDAATVADRFFTVFNNDSAASVESRKVVRRKTEGLEEEPTPSVDATVVVDDAASGFFEGVFQQVDGRGVGGVSSGPDAASQTAPTLDGKDIRHTTTPDIDAADHARENPAGDVELEAGGVGRMPESELSAQTVASGKTKLIDENGEEGAQTGMESLREDVTNGAFNAVNAKEGAVPAESAEIRKRFYATGEVEERPVDDDENTMNAKRFDSGEDGSVEGRDTSNLFPVEIEEALDELLRHGRDTNDISSPEFPQRQSSPSVAFEPSDKTLQNPLSGGVSSPTTAAPDILNPPANYFEGSDSSKPDKHEEKVGELSNSRKLPIFGQPGVKPGPAGAGGRDGGGGLGTETSREFLSGGKFSGKLNLPLDDLAKWDLPPLPVMDNPSLTLQNGKGKDLDLGENLDIRQAPRWRRWGQICARKARDHAQRIGKIAGEKGAVWSVQALVFCRGHADKLWQNHLRRPTERAHGRLDAFGRFLLAEVGEYMADPVLAELL